MSSVSHLLFADDILVFGQANKSIMMVVKEAIESFFNFTSMEVNRAKEGSCFLNM